MKNILVELYKIIGTKGARKFYKLIENLGIVRTFYSDHDYTVYKWKGLEFVHQHHNLLWFMVTSKHLEFSWEYPAEKYQMYYHLGIDLCYDSTDKEVVPTLILIHPHITIKIGKEMTHYPTSEWIE